MRSIVCNDETNEMLKLAQRVVKMSHYNCCESVSGAMFYLVDTSWFGAVKSSLNVTPEVKKPEDLNPENAQATPKVLHDQSDQSGKV